MDVHVTSAEFHQKVGVPFLNALLSKIKVAFEMEHNEPVQTLLELYPSEIQTADDTGFVMYSSKKIKILFSFYGKERSDTLAALSVNSPVLIFFNCHLAAPWQALGYSQGDSLTNLMAITVF